MSAAAELLKLGSATLHEALGKRGWLGPEIGALWPGARVAGRCRTVWSPPGDNLAVHLALERAEPGDVLCVATGGVWTHGLWGEVLMRAARARGVVGIVTSGGVRDLDELAAGAFPAFGRGAATQGTTKRSDGRHQVPVVLGCGVVASGDWLVGDRDGVVVVPGGELDGALAASHARLETERVAMAAIDAGTSSRLALAIAPEQEDRTRGPRA